MSAPGSGRPSDTPFSPRGPGDDSRFAAIEPAGDVLVAHLIAPYAKIVISVTPTTSQNDAASQIAMPEMMKALEVISSRHLANVISISDGTGEATYPNLAEILANNPGELGW
jgi:hypothetical protein